MCDTCGCDGTGVRYTGLPPHPHPHEHPHGEPSGGRSPESRTLVLEQRLLGRNDALASENRALFAGSGVLVVNLMSSPGSGKTTLLERTIRDLGAGRPLYVLEGDQETTLDAERIRAAGSRVVQVNTGAGCHLDAEMVRRGSSELAVPPGALLMIENVGNLVCPALFDLGENARVVVMSVTEGDDKPAKYPHMFRTADLVVLNKVDLLPHVEFDVGRCEGRLRALNPAADLLPVSATRGDGLSAWYRWLDARRPADTPSAPSTG